MLTRQPEPRLQRLRAGLAGGLATVRPEYQELRQAADWRLAIDALLDPDGQPPRSAAAVRTALWAYLDQLPAARAAPPRLRAFARTIRAVSRRFDAGLFHTYDVPGLPRTNNDREREVRDLTGRLLRMTGQKGLVRRLLQREGAWELLPRPASLPETTAALAQVPAEASLEERRRVRQHRRRFRLHVRAPKQATKQLEQIDRQWAALASRSPPE